MIDFERYHKRLAGTEPVKMVGSIQKAVGLVIESKGPAGSRG
jgi:hypothetical protein